MTDAETARPSPLLRFVVVFTFISLVLLGVFKGAEWRAENTALDRYCDSPQEHIRRAMRILQEPKPVENGERRAYIIAAKLLFLIPRREGEDIESYRARMTARMKAQCS